MAIGFNFRATSGYVTDGAGEVYVLATDAYPTTRGGVTFGWESTSGIAGANRNSGIDQRLAGLCYWTRTAQKTFRIDISAGTYNVTIAAGDAHPSVRHPARVIAYDNTSELSELFDVNNTTFGSHVDAVGDVYVNANWPGSNTPVELTFATTACRFVMGATSGTLDSNTSITHIALEEVGGGSLGRYRPILMMGVG